MSRRTPRQKILFICGSLNQTTQMHQVAAELPEHDRFFTPYYCTGLLELARRRGLLEMTIAGNKLATRCLSYLESQDLRIDPRGELGDYDLVVTCSDQVIPGNVIGRPIVLVQEGILDPITPIFHLARLLPIVPRWLAGTAATGQSNAFRRFCVASEGYRRFFERHGVDAAKIVVTGIPNFDDCPRYLVNDFPHRDYVLACTSDARETFKRDDRAQFIEYAVRVADGRPLIFKLHPNEDHPRAAAEIAAQAPGAKVFLEGSAEEMVANARVVICQYSSLAFVGLALGKEVHSYFDVEELRALMPIQNACAARNIAAVCREILEAEARTAEAAREPRRRPDRGRRTTVPAAPPPEARPAGGSATWSGGQSQ